MIHMDASGLSYQQLNEKIRSCREDVFLENCCGQRFLGAGMGKSTSVSREPPATPWELTSTVPASRCWEMPRTRWETP